MSILGGSKKSFSSSNVQNSDERIAASDFANVVQAESGSTINFGVSGSEFAAALNVGETPRFEAERRQFAEALAGVEGDGGGNTKMLLIGAAALLLFILLRG